MTADASTIRIRDVVLEYFESRSQGNNKYAKRWRLTFDRLCAVTSDQWTEFEAGVVHEPGRDDGDDERRTELDPA